MKRKFVFVIRRVFLVLLGVLAEAGLAYSADLVGMAVVAQGDLPVTGLFAASNDFSQNSTINITNLENRRTIQVVVSKGFGTGNYGILLTLSREAANALGIGWEPVRVRAALSTDSAPFSRYQDGRSFSGDPDYDSRAFVRSNSWPLSGTAVDEAQSSVTGTATIQPFHTYSPPNNTGSSVTPFSDGLSLQSGQNVSPTVVAAPPTPVDPVIFLPTPTVQDIPVLRGSGHIYSPETKDTLATATEPYQDPGQSVINTPLPEMSSTARVVVSGQSEDSTPSFTDTDSSATLPQVFSMDEPVKDTDDVELELPAAEGGLAVIPEYSIIPPDETAPVSEEPETNTDTDSSATLPQVFSMDEPVSDTDDAELELPPAEGGLAVIPEYSIIPPDGTAPVTEEPETNDDVILAGGADAIELSRMDDIIELFISEEPEYFNNAFNNADALMPLGEPASVADETGLYEPGYAISVDDKKGETGTATESVPLVPDDGITMAGELASTEDGGLVEPGYVFLEAESATVPDDGITTAGELASVEDGGLVEPGYIFLETEDEIVISAESAMVPDDGITTVGATALLGELATVGEGELDEPGYTFVEIQDETVGAAGADAALLLGEPESAFGVGGGEEFGAFLAEPGFRAVTLDTADAETGEERQDTVSSVTITPPDSPGSPAVYASVETVGDLQAGMYYVQIGGYTNTTRIDAIINELGGAYPLVLMSGRYILIGPLNEGESNAVELQFRAKGFTNAFVVRGNGSR
jgi:hypothetical protein